MGICPVWESEKIHWVTTKNNKFLEQKKGSISPCLNPKKDKSNQPPKRSLKKIGSISVFNIELWPSLFSLSIFVRNKGKCCPFFSVSFWWITSFLFKTGGNAAHFFQELFVELGFFRLILFWVQTGGMLPFFLKDLLGKRCPFLSVLKDSSKQSTKTFPPVWTKIEIK